ncbi:MAG: hypothetical protein ACLFTV_06605 [Desulfococcaceae bacterium]
MAAAALAMLGWVQTVAKFSSRLVRAEKDIAGLKRRQELVAEKSDVREDIGDILKQIDKLSKRLEAMDASREGARSEVADFRERISRELGEISAALSPLMRPRD